MSPSEIPGDFDELEPIEDGADLEPLLDGDELEPIEAEVPAHTPEVESLPDIPKQDEISELEPLEEPEPEPEPEPASEPEVDLEAMLVEEDSPAEEPEGAATAAAASSGDAPAEEEAKSDELTEVSEPAGSREQPVKRVLEKAPLMLLKASQYLMIASLLPFAGAFDGWGPASVEKLICAAGLWIAITQTNKGNRNGVFFGLFVSLLGFYPLLHEFTALLLEGGKWVEAMHPNARAVLLEKFTLMCAGLTYVHIIGYQNGGKFNPLYAVLLTEPLFAGVGGLMGLMGSAPQVNHDEMSRSAFAVLLGCIGAIVVAGCGAGAVRTMVVTMKEAKAEGEAKRAAAIEARRAARKAGKKVEPLRSRKSKD